MDKSNKMLKAALGLAKQGFFVFPVVNKRPLTAHGFHDATTNRQQIRKWWTQWPEAGVATDCSRTGLVAFDIDGDEGKAAWKEFDPHVPTMTVETGGGGLHLIYKAPTGVEIHSSVGTLAPGLDVRAAGGYIVLPPSIHESGRAYKFINRRKTVLLPDSLLEILQASMHRHSAASGQANRLSLPYALAALQDESNKVRFSHNGTRNDTLNHAAFRSGQFVGAGVLDRAEVEQELFHAAQSVRLAENEALRTIESGLNAGVNQPRAAARSAKQRPTDDELRDRWIAGRNPTAFGLGEYHRYENGIWKALPEETVRSEIASVLEAAKPEDIRPSARLLASVQELARIKIFIPSERWDADSDVLVCTNGTLHLPTRVIRPHSPDDLVTVGLSYAYEAKAKAPTWERFLTEQVPDAAEFLMEFAGYALTTDTSFELAVWLYGSRGSGKSTFLTGLQAMLGPKAGLLGLADMERSRFALVNLPGKTLAVASEQPAGYISTAYLLNAIISGEQITVERKFHDAVTVTPRAKLCWAMNELPRVGDASSGLFRRVKVVRFPDLAESRRDPTVKAAIANEGAGILNWALEGLSRLRRRGSFKIPTCVRDATADFQATNDVPALFVAECCVREKAQSCKIQSQVLYDNYRRWCDNNGHKAQSSTSLANEWVRLGFEKRPVNGKAYWHGLMLKPV